MGDELDGVMKEYRCTRATIYPTDTPLSDRQGHYVNAFTEDLAHLEMARRFPGEARFTVTLWKVDGRRV